MIADRDEALFSDSPALTVHDPLAHLLGVGDGTWTYRFDDAVRLAGHACPALYPQVAQTSRYGAVSFDFIS
ncbi:hypothetical protein [Thioalkalivibrio nitratireducens]|uniref:hypothetical protein n=1 Tax=Thioalkalivibrio nitratireducens TaxID=186931 RepID=UPI0005C21CAE|nr:hypothetical protein [Thioalkalivibrio nitratireducens]